MNSLLNKIECGQMHLNPIGDSKYAISSSGINQPIEEIQSPSLTVSGCLWQATLAQMRCEQTNTISSSAAIANEEAEKIVDLQKRYNAHYLLKSWIEEDEEYNEEEELAAFEELKHAIDEDRLSDRKLFS